MFDFMIVDDTICRNIYFYNEEKAMAYFNSKNHTMTLYIKTIIGWKERDYKKRSVL